jgi:hypothetical protein
MRNTPYNLFSVTKVNEGGMGQVHALQLIKEAGIPVVRAHSPYMGHSGVAVLTDDKRKLRRVEILLYGRS